MHNFVTKELVTDLGVQCVPSTPMLVTLADDSQVRTASMASLQLQICDDRGNIIQDAT